MVMLIDGTVTDKLTTFTAERCAEYIQEAEALRNTIVLADDPIADLGFQGINGQIAQIQACRERMSTLLLQSLKNKSNAQRQVNAAKADYLSQYSIVMATDTEVISQTSKEKREAAASVKVSEQYTALQTAEDLLAEASLLHQIISTLAKDLECKQEQLLEQIAIIRMTLSVHPELKSTWNPQYSNTDSK